MYLEDIVEAQFVPFSDILRAHGALRGEAIALADETRGITWRELDAMVDRVAAALQRDGVQRQEPVAIVGANSVEYALAFLGAVRAGAIATPLTSSATPAAIAAMLADCGSRILLADAAMSAQLAGEVLPEGLIRVALESGASGIPFDEWLAPEGAQPAPHTPAPTDGFNIIYSSGTTGTPKGIVQSHQMRMEHLRRTVQGGYGDHTVVINSTPLYSNTTLVSFIPALAAGGKVVLMKKFDARKFLELSERECVTNAMLVPVQYRRIMDLPDFDSFDLSSYILKTCTSAPFSAELKADVLKRWPGGLMEIYGMTEGGGTCLLLAHEFPDKLHTVGRPQPGHVIKIIDEAGNELPQGEVGEVVGHSPAMMNGYHNQPGKTRETEWHDAEGRRYIRHGDVARFDEDGFLILMDRAKDLIISGGFNIYPSDLEAELLKHPAVREAAVVGVPSRDWGESPVGVVVLADKTADLGEILSTANARLGKTQRISRLEIVDEMPRSTIGKVLKRELRDRFGGNPVSGPLTGA